MFRTPVVAAVGLTLLGATACGAGDTVAGTPTTTGNAHNVAGIVAPTTAPVAAAADWTISLPSSINGYPRLANPSSRTQQELQQGMQQAEQIGGVSGGTAVSGVYDDAADHEWLVVLGVNGSGFDGSELVSNVQHRQGVDIGDAASTIIPEPATVGPHGGSAICDQSSETIDTIDGAISASTGVCYWMTPTTFGVVTLITQVGSPISAFFVPVSKVNDLMQTVRPAVETQR